MIKIAESILTKCKLSVAVCSALWRNYVPQTHCTTPTTPIVPQVERITSVLGSGVTWKGQLGGSGGVRIEGTFEGEIALRGLLVVGETGRVTCEQLRAHVVIVAGIVRGDISGEKWKSAAPGGCGVMWSVRLLPPRKGLSCAARSPWKTMWISA